MDWIVIEGVRPYDGRYEFDIGGQELTTREWGWIKRLTGYLPLTLEDGFNGADPELFACFAVIALRRASKVEPREVPNVFERIADGPFGSTIRVESDTAEEAEDDAGPPEANSNGSSPSSGDASPTSSETSGAPPNPVGTPALDSSESPLTRSGI